jgi:hypothetical protein
MENCFRALGRVGGVALRVLGLYVKLVTPVTFLLFAL